MKNDSLSQVLESAEGDILEMDRYRVAFGGFNCKRVGYKSSKSGRYCFDAGELTFVMVLMN